MITISNIDKAKKLNEEVNCSNLSQEAKSVINELIANDMAEFLNMAVPKETCYTCGKEIEGKAKQKVIYEGTDLRPDPVDFQTVKVCSNCK
jgi:hypothetical protein